MHQEGKLHCAPGAAQRQAAARLRGRGGTVWEAGAECGVGAGQGGGVQGSAWGVTGHGRGLQDRTGQGYRAWHGGYRAERGGLLQGRAELCCIRQPKGYRARRGFVESGFESGRVRLILIPSQAVMLLSSAILVFCHPSWCSDREGSDGPLRSIPPPAFILPIDLHARSSPS